MINEVVISNQNSIPSFIKKAFCCLATQSNGSSKGSAQEQTFSIPPRKRNHRYRSEDRAERINCRRVHTLFSESEIYSLPRISNSCRGDIEQLHKKHPSLVTNKKTSNRHRTTSRTPVDELRRRYAQKSLGNFSSTIEEHSMYLAKDYEENWSKPFSVTLNPGDENLPIKILNSTDQFSKLAQASPNTLVLFKALSRLCSTLEGETLRKFRVPGFLVCDLCTSVSKLPLRVGDLIVKMEANEANAKSVRLLVRRFKRCPSLSSSDSNLESLEWQPRRRKAPRRKISTSDK
ncbi:hypothetical protein ACTXT7_010332, partial [Hymenolepis weldensis]